MNEKGYVEELSGLAEVRRSYLILQSLSSGVTLTPKQVQRTAEEALSRIDWSDEEVVEEEGEGEMI